MDSMRQRAKGLPSSACLNRLCFPLLSLRPRSQFPIMVIRKLADFVRSGFAPLRPFKYQPNMVGVTGGYSPDRKTR